MSASSSSTRASSSATELSGSCSTSWYSMAFPPSFPTDDKRSAAGVDAATRVDGERLQRREERAAADPLPERRPRRAVTADDASRDRSVREGEGASAEDDVAGRGGRDGDLLDGLARAQTERGPCRAVPARGAIDLDGARPREIPSRVENSVGEAERGDLLEPAGDAFAERGPPLSVPCGDGPGGNIAGAREAPARVDPASPSRRERQHLTVALSRPDARTERLPGLAVPARDPRGVGAPGAREPAAHDEPARLVDQDRVHGGRAEIVAAAGHALSERCPGPTVPARDAVRVHAAGPGEVAPDVHARSREGDRAHRPVHAAPQGRPRAPI